MVREPVVDDAMALGRVHVRAWQAAYGGGLMPADYLEHLSADERGAMWASALAGPAHPKRARYVGDADGEVAGFIVVGPEDDDIAAPRGQVFVINVDPDHWGSGIAGELFAAGIAALESFGFESAVLWVLPGNARARAFYERRGWSPDGSTKTETILDVEVTEIRYLSAPRSGGPTDHTPGSGGSPEHFRTV